MRLNWLIKVTHIDLVVLYHKFDLAIDRCRHLFELVLTHALRYIFCRSEATYKFYLEGRIRIGSLFALKVETLILDTDSIVLHIFVRLIESWRPIVGQGLQLGIRTCLPLNIALLSFRLGAISRVIRRAIQSLSDDECAIGGWHRRFHIHTEPDIVGGQIDGVTEPSVELIRLDELRLL